LPASSRPIRDERLLYAVMLLVLESVYGWTWYAAPEVRAPARLIPFTALMLLHAGLHLAGPRLAPRRRWLPLYFAAQGALIFALTQITADSQATVTLYLYLALAAQAIGLLNTRPRLAALVVVGILLLGVINFAWLRGRAALPAFLWLAAPQTLFVLAFVALFFQQASARRRAQELLRELETAHRRLAGYAAQVEELTLTAERQRLARELHDTLAQGLAGLILQLEAVDSQLARGRPERAQAIIAQAMERARTTLADARRAIDDLRAETESDLADAVRAEADRFTAATGIPCSLDLALPPAIPLHAREHILRVVSEGLANVARHARANQAWVRVGGHDPLEVLVRDDGVGFDPAAADGHAGHYGLIGLRERARLLGGAFEVTSAPGAGTTLRLSLPNT